MTKDPTPQEALASIHAVRAGLASDMRYPVSYDLLYGAVCALLVAGQGLPSPWSFMVLPVAIGGLAFLTAWWRKQAGWWVSGYSPKRARWVAYGMGAVFVGLICLSLYGRFYGPWWLFLVSGGLGFVAAIVGARLWMWVWREELADGGQ